MSDLKCSVYDLCGGCHFQHLELSAYQDKKTLFFQSAFAHLNLSDAIFQTPIFIPPLTRRRTIMSFFKDNSQYVWGYKQEKSHKIISAKDCIIVTPQILNAMKALAEWVSDMIPNNIQLKAYITEYENGLDISLKGISLDQVRKYAKHLEDFYRLVPHVIRLSIDYQKVSQIQAPILMIDRFKLYPQGEVFLQASDHAQRILIAKVIEAIGKTKPKKTKIIDLFSGIGTFSLPLTDFGHVRAYDSAHQSLEALQVATQTHHLEHRLSIYRRDLFRDPVSFIEMKDIDIAVIDPPRAGALAQMKQLAQSNIQKIIYVFCDPHSAARDLGILLDKGYKIQQLMAIDQFTYSKHIEGIAVLARV